jgi:hypothetical protein
MARFLSYSLMHVLDYILDRLPRLFRFNNYPLGEKAYSVILHAAGLSLRDLSERHYATMASGESVGDGSTDSQEYPLWRGGLGTQLRWMRL